MCNLDNSLQRFIQRNSSFLKNPLIQSFLQLEDNQHLLIQIIEQKNSQASFTLDQRFELFYLKVRMLHYINKLAKFYSQTYDQKHRKQRSELIFDVSLQTNTESQSTLGDIIPAPYIEFEDVIPQTIQELLPTKEMESVFNSFSEKKQKVLDLYVFGQFSNKEIAEQLACTPQNISKLKTKAFAQLKGAK